jgi:phosphoribosylformylglycinamidine cyclo-ligase
VADRGKGGARRLAYAAAGVDVGAGDRTVELIRTAIESTRRVEVVGGLGGFAGAIALPSGLRDPVLVGSTDGVGTKTAIAAACGRFEGLGIDLVAMTADDVVCAGAAPLFLLDYVAVGSLDPEVVADVVEGIAAACREVGAAIIGGETAEHPGVMRPGAIDLSATCVGVVERDELLDGEASTAGDVIVGLTSSGLHSNGFSLVRSLLAQWDIPLDRPYQEQLRRSLGDAATEAGVAAEPSIGLATMADVLLIPTRIYAPAVLAVRSALRAAGHDLHGAAHVTGGGLPGNVPRALPDGLAARLDPARWPMPSVMRLFGALGGLEDEELRATFNGGLGFVLIMPRAGADLALRTLADHGYHAAVVGDVVPIEATRGQRYVEGELTSDHDGDAA